MPLDDVAVTPLDRTRFRDVLSPQGQAQFEHAITRGRELLDGRTLWNVNSTAHGGGVAEMLRSLIGYARGVGIDARWLIIGGDPEFFRITKRLHNRLHGYAGDGGPLGEAERAVYERVAAEHADLLAQRVRPATSFSCTIRRPPAWSSRWSRRACPSSGARTSASTWPNERAREAWRFLIAYVRARRRLRLLAPRLHVGGPRPRQGHGHRPVDRRLLAEEPRRCRSRRVTAVLRAAGLAADHHHHSRAIFERLDGTRGPRRARGAT